jgi:hypothetical protein
MWRGVRTCVVGIDESVGCIITQRGPQGEVWEGNLGRVPLTLDFVGCEGSPVAAEAKGRFFCT